MNNIRQAIKHLRNCQCFRDTLPIVLITWDIEEALRCLEDFEWVESQLHETGVVDGKTVETDLHESISPRAEQ